MLKIRFVVVFNIHFQSTHKTVSHYGYTRKNSIFHNTVMKIPFPCLPLFTICVIHEASNWNRFPGRYVFKCKFHTIICIIRLQIMFPIQSPCFPRLKFVAYSLMLTISYLDSLCTWLAWVLCITQADDQKHVLTFIILVTNVSFHLNYL